MTANATPAKPNSPHRQGFVITPHDTNELAAVTRGIYVGGAGNVSLILADDGAAVTFIAPPVGTILPVSAKIVKATLTTATNLIGLY